jgi:putative transposase
MSEVWESVMRTPGEIEKVVMVRLDLYNRALPCGAKAIRHRLLDDGDVRPVPSVRTIGRILSRQCLTHCRTGYYEEDYV